MRRQRVWEAFIQPESSRALLAYRLCTLTLDEQTCPVEKEGKKGVERKRKEKDQHTQGFRARSSK